MSLHLAIIGKSGQLARALIREGEARGHIIIALDRSALDLRTTPKDIEAEISALPSGLDGIILAAAYTNVDGAESDASTAYAVNATAPAAIARACYRHDIPLIHISSDYVFDGEAEQPYLPDDDTDPLGIYGASKLDGELAVIESGARALIIRTSWVFDGTGKNFLTAMLQLAEKGKSVSVVDDQFGRPTYAGHLAQAILKAMETIAEDPEFVTTVYHVTGGGEPTNWAGFAKSIFRMSNLSTKVEEIPASDFPSPAKRPVYTVLETEGFEHAFRHPLPDWQAGVRAALEERSEK